MASHRKYDEAGLNYADLQPRDYSSYFLLSNPFPSIPVAEEEPRVFVDREREIKSVEYVTKEAFSTGKSQTLLIQGAYGNGKSHVLKYIRSRINAQLARNPERKGVAVYVESPGSSVKDLYAGIVGDLGIDLLRNLSYWIIANTTDVSSLKDYIHDASMRRDFSQLVQEIRNDPTVLGQILSRRAFRIRDIRYDILKKIGSSFSFPDVLTAALSLAEEEISIVAWRWLLGEPLSRDERSSIGVEREIEESSDVLRALSSIKRLLGMAGFIMTYVMLDELESISELHVMKRSAYYNDFRHLIDQNTEGLCLIACVTPAGWALIQSGGIPLASRLMGNVEDLSPFDQAKSRRLIEAYLELGHEEFAEAKGISSVSDLNKQISAKYGVSDPKVFPFVEESLRVIQEIGRGNVREILRICKRLIDAGCDSHIPVFDKTDVIYGILDIPAPTSA